MPSIGWATFKKEAALRKLEKLKKLFAERMHLTTDDIAEALPTTTRTAQVYAKYMREQKLIYVSRWELRSNKYMAVYRRGNRPDARQPDPKPKSKVMRDYWSRLKKNQPERYQEKLRNDRARRAVKAAERRAQKLNPMDAWVRPLVSKST